GGSERAPAARERSIGGALVAIVVPPGLVAAPHANAARADHRQKRHLVARKDQADGRRTEPFAPETGHRAQIGRDVVSGHTGFPHEDMREGVRPELLTWSDVYGPGPLGREVQLAGSVQLGVAGADREGRVLVAGRPVRGRGVLVPGPAGAGARAC